VIRGTLAAAATPLTEDDDGLDEAAFGPLTDFLAAAGLDGVLLAGTTGEGMLLTLEERKRATELFLEASGGRLRVIAHCGAQSTAGTVALADHAAEAGADGVAVIAPPYFALDRDELLAHLESAARACAPTPFYVYELKAASGYAVPVDVLARLRESAPNFVGMKVSDRPWEAFEPYLIEGLEIFVGPEGLIHRGISAGAVGAVSALATAFPELVARAVRGDADDSARVGALRDEIDRFPRHAALKHVLSRRGVPIGERVRRPLRELTADERRRLDELVSGYLET
jgi:dihydrodipicolinate synthase/N-acetylneuraminate lyase